MMDRRTFLATGATAAAAALGSNRLLAAIAERTPPTPDLSTWENVRAQFALSKEQLHFSTFFIASHPRPVRDAIEAYRKAIDAEPYLEVDQRMFQDRPDNIQMVLRSQMSGYLGAKPDEIAITTSTTNGLALVYAGLPLKPGDEVLTSTHDHYSQHESIRFAVQKAGASMRKFTLYASAPVASVEEMTSNLRAAIRPATRVVGLTWVHSCTGVRIPARALADVLAEANRGRAEKDRIVMVLDGAHGLGAVDETVATLGCDYFCAGTHKWMLGPRGTGIVWARAESWARLTPTIPSFASMAAWNTWMKNEPPTRPVTSFDVTPGGFHAFEHQWAIGAAFQFHEAIGRTRASSRIQELNDRCKAGLAASRGVKVVTPIDPALSAGIICFDMNGKSAEQVGNELVKRQIVAGPSPYLPSYPRLSPSLVNSPQEVDRAVQAVREIVAA
jgi:selenocysteine lyase/cysteine desulfurase